MHKKKCLFGQINYRPQSQTENPDRSKAGKFTMNLTVDARDFVSTFLDKLPQNGESLADIEQRKSRILQALGNKNSFLATFLNQIY